MFLPVSILSVNISFASDKTPSFLELPLAALSALFIVVTSMSGIA